MISTLPVEAAATKPKLDTTPRLESGDHLTRAEFERRYAMMPYNYHLKRHVYRRSSVRGYLIWRADDTAIDWFALENGE